MTTERILGMWMLPSGIEIFEVEFDGDRYELELCVGVRHVVPIFPATPEDTEDVRAGLDDSEDVDEVEEAEVDEDEVLS